MDKEPAGAVEQPAPPKPQGFVSYQMVRGQMVRVEDTSNDSNDSMCCVDDERTVKPVRQGCGSTTAIADFDEQQPVDEEGSEALEAVNSVVMPIYDAYRV